MNEQTAEKATQAATLIDADASRPRINDTKAQPQQLEQEIASLRKEILELKSLIKQK